MLYFLNHFISSVIATMLLTFFVSIINVVLLKQKAYLFDHSKFDSIIRSILGVLWLLLVLAHMPILLDPWSYVLVSMIFKVLLYITVLIMSLNLLMNFSKNKITNQVSSAISGLFGLTGLVLLTVEFTALSIGDQDFFKTTNSLQFDKMGIGLLCWLVITFFVDNILSKYPNSSFIQYVRVAFVIMLMSYATRSVMGLLWSAGIFN